MMYEHHPVMLREVMAYLQPKTGGTYIDATLGGGGHTRALLEAGGRVLGIDADELAIGHVQKTLNGFEKNVIFVHDNFRNIKRIAEERQVRAVDGIVMDLGLSSAELDDPTRGFGFQSTGPLDMRFDRTGTLTADQIINEWDSSSLETIFTKYGEERLAAPIVRALLERRALKRLGAQDIVEIISTLYQRYYHHRSRIHPATKVFQALRIAVNDELTSLREALPEMIALLRPAGRLAVITFHSLEDRIVKQMFRREAKGCVCPPGELTCQCKHVQTITILTKKPVVPTREEVSENPRSRSAKLRVVEKI